MTGSVGGVHMWGPYVGFMGGVHGWGPHVGLGVKICNVCNAVIRHAP